MLFTNHVSEVIFVLLQKAIHAELLFVAYDKAVGNKSLSCLELSVITGCLMVLSLFD